MSSNLVISIFLIGLAGLVMVWLWRRSAGKVERAPGKPAVAAQALFTKSEEEMFKRLCTALPVFYVFPKVSLDRLLAPAEAEAGKSDFAKIARSAIDFAIYDAALELICVIDLEGPEGLSEADALIDYCLQSAGIKSIRWKENAKPSIAQISRYIIPLASQGKSRPDKEKTEANDTVLMMYRNDPVPSNVSGLTVPTLDKLTPNKVLLNLYPHVWQRICVFALEPKHLQKYLITLSLQDRADKRAGFTIEALKEIADISKENDRFLTKPAETWQPGILNP